MKIIVTKAEVAALVRKTFNLDAAVEVEILDISIPPDALRVINAVKALRYKTDQKIQSIKTIRDGMPGLGLADAKYIVENFDKYLSVLESTGRLPVVKQSSDWSHSIS